MCLRMLIWADLCSFLWQVIAAESTREVDMVMDQLSCS